MDKKNLPALRKNYQIVTFNNVLKITNKVINERELNLINKLFKSLNFDIQLKFLPKNDLFFFNDNNFIFDYELKNLINRLSKFKNDKTALDLLDMLYNINKNNWLYYFIKAIIFHDEYEYFYNKLLTKALLINNYLFFPKYLLLLQLYKNGDCSVSRELMLKSIKIISNSNLKNKIKQKILEEMGKWCDRNVSYTEMAQCYIELIQIDTSNKDYYRLCSYAQYKDGDYKNAKINTEMYKKLENNLKIKNEPWWFKRINEELNRKDIDLEFYEKYIKKYKNKVYADTNIWYEYLYEYIKKEYFDEK